MDKIRGTLSGVSAISGSLSTAGSMSGSISLPEVRPPDIYDGEYTFTPSEEQQEIQIDGMMATQNITIEPIPSNYGRISWDGRRLTVE